MESNHGPFEPFRRLTKNHKASSQSSSQRQWIKIAWLTYLTSGKVNVTHYSIRNMKIVVKSSQPWEHIKNLFRWVCKRTVQFSTYIESHWYQWSLRTALNGHYLENYCLVKQAKNENTIYLLDSARPICHFRRKSDEDHFKLWFSWSYRISKMYKTYAVKRWKLRKKTFHVLIFNFRLADFFSL